MSRIMITKLLPPRISGELMERSRLLELFTRKKDLKLMVLTAPAGYGKTVSILQYVSTLAAPFVWYQLDQYDNDPAVFIQYLIAGIERHVPGFGGETLQLVLQSNVGSSLRSIVIALINELAGLPEPGLTVVLDDYHVIFTPEIHRFVQELLEYLPAGIQVVIASRISPPLNFSRYQIAGEAVMLDSDTLRFTASEMREFISQRQLAPSQEAVDSLMARTAGWPAALKLLAASGAQKDLTLQAKDAEYIYDYLANEVLDWQPEEIREFLISTAVLETITPEMADLLLKRNDSRKLLENLEKQQLFLIPLAGPSKAYRYHQLFRDFLLERLGPRKNHLLRKAGEIARQNEDWDQAMEYFVAAGSGQDLGALLEKAGRQAFRQRRWQTVERWLGLLDRGQIAATEWLSLFQAKIAVYRGKLTEAENWLNKSKAGFANRQHEVGIAECQFLQAKILNRNGCYQESMNLLAKAYAVLQQSEPVFRFELPLEKALLFIRMGRLQQAEDLLLKGLQVVAEHDDPWMTAHFLEGLGWTYYMLGRTIKALEYYEKAARLSPGGILPNYFPDFIPFLYQELGEMDRALAYLRNSIAIKEKNGLFESLIPDYYQLSCIYTDIGELEEAETVYQKGVQLIAEIGGERFFWIVLKVNLGRIRALQGRLPEAQVIMEQVLTDSQSESGVALLINQIFYGLVLLLAGQFKEAETVLLDALQSEIEFAKVLNYAYFLLASTKFATGDQAEADRYSQKLLNFSASKHFEQMYVFMVDNLYPVIRFGLENAVQISFIQRVLVLLGERGLPLLTELSTHPDPEIRSRSIYPLSQINNAAAKRVLQLLAADPDLKLRQLVKQCSASSDLSLEIDQPNLSQLNQKPRPAPKTKPAGKGEVRELSPSSAITILHIEMLGPIRIVLNRQDITNIKWRFTKSRDLLLYLTHQGQPVVINRILEDLWPDLPLEKAMNNFYTALHWLRRVIQKDCPAEVITYASKTCQLLPGLYDTDRRRFATLINEVSGKSQLSSKEPAVLEEALSLYRGHYLCQLDYSWLIPEREHLKRIQMETAIRLAKYYLQNREHFKTAKLLEPLAAENPLREEIHGLLMSAYAGLGDKRAVIRQYQQLRTHLDEELGLAPAPEIVKLYYQLCGSKESP
jgi:DNA-binding SARP family transcriptional activator/Tfp pilus assembly protein PilF